MLSRPTPGRYRLDASWLRKMQPQCAAMNAKGGPGHTVPSRPAVCAPVRRPLQRCAAASAVMLSTRRTVAAGVRMCTVPATPVSIGPTVTPPLAVVFMTL